MDAIDVLIVLFVVTMAFWGYRQGLIVGALSLAGFAAGALIGSRLGPELLDEGARSPYAPLMTLIGAMLLGGIVAIGFEGIAWGIRGRVVRSRGHGVVDGVGGALLIGAVGLGIAWIAGAAALNTPGAGELRRDIQRSAILKRLNSALPPTGPILNALNRIDPTPSVDGPQAEVKPPAKGIARDPDVDRAGNSVVKVLGTACGLGVGGSGWVAGRNLVVTNAHVVAGQDDTTVTPRNGGQRLDAVPVHYDARNDLAILRVSLLDRPALRLVADPRAGASAAVLGYPEDGPFTIEPARLGATETVISQDAYGRGPVRRMMSSIRGRVRSGNSGGPAVNARGRVLTTVFAAQKTKQASGLGIPNSVVRRALARARGPVSTGPCAR